MKTERVIRTLDEWYFAQVPRVFSPTDTFKGRRIVQRGATRSIVLTCQRTRVFAKGASSAAFAVATVEFTKAIGRRTCSTVLTILVAVTGMGIIILRRGVGCDA